MTTMIGLPKAVFLSSIAVLFAGCGLEPVHHQNANNVPQAQKQAYAAPHQQYPTMNQAPHVQQLQPVMPVQKPQMPQQSNHYSTANGAMVLHRQTMAEIQSVKARLQRTERAMIRLDRRMQLLERNELSRMSDISADVEPVENAPQQHFKPMSLTQPAAAPQAAFKPVAYRQQSAPVRRAPLARGAAAMRPGFRPVAYTPNQGRGIVGATPSQNNLRTASVAQPAPSSLSVRLPSLADQEKKQRVSDDATVSIWTVQYQDNKVWPNRDQLAKAREVVEALRSGEPLAVFARGKTPASKQFRERVRALSKYLGQVAQMDSVPIASMPATHLDGDTIEILTTR